MTDTATTPSPRHLDALVIALFATVVPFLFGSSPQIFADGDVSWHVATGHWILDHGSVPSTDPFSFTAYGRHWVPQEWLADIAAALATQAFGNAGLAMLVSLSLALTFLIVGFEVRRWATPVQLALTLLTLSVLLVPFTLARPHVFAWPLLAGWIVLLLRLREQRRVPPLWMAGVIIFWANLHASYAFGLALAAFFALEALVEEPDKQRVFVRWGLFGLALLGAALLTPHGLAGLIYPFFVMQMTSLSVIGEWRATTVSATPTFGLALLATIAALAWRGTRVPTLRLLLLLLLLGLALKQMRHQPLWGIASALLLARPIAMSFGRGDEREPFWRQLGVRRIGRAWLAVAAAFALLAFGRAMLPIVRPQSSTDPTAAIAHIPPALRRQPVLNTYSFGGPLIAAGIRPFIDGRADMYGDAFTLDYQAINTGDPARFAHAIKRFRLAWAITEKGNNELLRLIDRTPGWRRLYADDHAVIHIRDAPLGPPLPILPPSNGR